jgi:hypothetical protein
MEKQLTDADYIKKINKRYKQIGTPYAKPKTMAFMADGETQELEEPDGTFTSMNFAFKLIMELPGKYLVLMNKEQAIRFVRVVKQRILKSLNNDIDFINLHLSKDERKAFIGKINDVFIQKLTNRIRDVVDKHNITNEDLIEDNPPILKRYIVTQVNMPYVPDVLAPDDLSNDEYKVSTNESIDIEKDIEVFQVEMEFLDDEDKAKYTEEDTEDIRRSIVRLKNEFLSKFTYEVNHFFQQTYKEELDELFNKSIRLYTERLGDIRKEGRFTGSTGFQKYNKKLFGVRREQEQERKIKYDAKKNMNAFVPTEIGQVLNAPKKRPTVPKPRTRKKNTTAYAPTAYAPTAFAPTENVLGLPAPKKRPIPRTRKKITNAPRVNANAPRANAPVLIAPKKIPTPRTRKLKSKLNEANVKGAPVTVPTAKVMPKPRTRQSRKKINQPHFNQPNTSL